MACPDASLLSLTQRSRPPVPSRQMIYRVCIALFALATSARGFEASEPDPEVPGATFNKDELEEILRKEHSDQISNVYDSQNDIQ